MDPEFQRLVDAAAEVAATGRWDAVNERIKNLAASPGPDSAWHVGTSSSERPIAPKMARGVPAAMPQAPATITTEIVDLML